ncbi:MAG TPA: hypothetical protein VKS79_22570, partial [Gemmataceae bacterium]|nr:hypothetical protein [Gemmataceae bacterium]
ASPLRTRTLFGWALFITAAQILFAMLLSSQGSISAAWRSLYQWDGGWFQSIVDGGYVAPDTLTPTDHGNVAFFPGYPLLARSLKNLFHLDGQAALLMTAQLACCGAWFYALLLLRSWNVSPGNILVAVVLVAVHPASFFMVASYSEPLFLMTMLGYVYWSQRSGPLAKCLAAVHGFAMTATRLVGIAVIVYPVLQTWLASVEQFTWRKLCQSVLVAAFAALGAGAFFAFCHFYFGRWDLYVQTEAVAWGVKPDYLALFRRHTYGLSYLDLPRYYSQPDFLSRVAVPATVALFALMGVLEMRSLLSGNASGWRDRLPLLLCAFGPFYIAACGHARRDMGSQIRHSQCVYVLLVLFAAHLWARNPAMLRPKWVRALLIVWSAASLSLEITMAHRFTHGLWVA